MSAFLTTLTASHYRDVPGIMALDSGVAGPTVAILACTHGNEPVGLDVLEYLLSDLRLERGRLLAILVNIEAAKTDRRYIDHNMNRVPDNLAEWAGSVEGERLAALLPLLNEVDGGVLDLHSTSAEAPAMLICVDDHGQEMAACPTLPFDHVLSGITPFLSGRFIIEHCANAPLKLLAECGQHQCPEAANRGIAISLAFLRKLGMVEWHGAAEAERASNPKHFYRVKASVSLPEAASDPFRLLQCVEPFEYLQKGQKIACNGNEQVVAPCDGYAIMCPKTEQVLDKREALLFLCDGPPDNKIGRVS